MLTDWFHAVEELHQWFIQLDSVISDYEVTEFPLTSIGFGNNSQWTLAELMQLRRETMYKLENLKSGINFVTEKKCSVLTFQQLSKYTTIIINLIQDHIEWSWIRLMRHNLSHITYRKIIAVSHYQSLKNHYVIYLAIIQALQQQELSKLQETEQLGNSNDSFSFRLN